jgi:hypothetical protein
MHLKNQNPTSIANGYRFTHDITKVYAADDTRDDGNGLFGSTEIRGNCQREMRVYISRRAICQ